MFKFLFYVIFLGGAFLFIYTFQPPTICDNPISYKIGTIDNRYNTTKSQFLIDVRRAADTWSFEYGRPLFSYNTTNKKSIVINMTYDERQEYRNEINDQKGQVTQEEGKLTFDIREFDRRSEAFKKKLEDFNKQVEYWNSQGGAPKDEFDKLVKQQDELKKEAEELNAMASTLNQSVDKFNVDIVQLNKTVDTFNTVLQDKPEQGLYDPKTNTITIFFHDNKQELIHTLAHEFGHALTIDHIPDPKAIMYEKTNLSTTLAPKDALALQNACKKRTIYELIKKKIDTGQLRFGLE